VEWCIKNEVLKDFLIEHSTEVMSMSLLNWTVEDENAYREAVGREEGREAERYEILELLEKEISPEIAERTKALLARQGLCRC
jgi:hypothetical protein